MRPGGQVGAGPALRLSASIPDVLGAQALRQRMAREVPWVPLGLVTGVGLTSCVLAWLMEHGSYDMFAAALVLIALVAISVPLLRRAIRLEVEPRIARLLWLALGCKLAAAIVRYAVAFGLYDGNADASVYHDVGAILARQFRDGDFVIDLGRRVQGTGFIQIVTGAVYTITGATDLGGFFFFSWLGFWGLYFFHRAFVHAVPDGDHLRYARLVFFLPSLLFWPSSVGKEAWMCLGLGVSAYGAARLLTGSRGGLAAFIVGLVALSFVRPHVAALVAAGVLTAYVFRPHRKNRAGLAPFTKLIGVVVLGGILVIAVGELESYMGVDAFDQESVQLTLDEVTEQTGQGGSYTGDTQTDLSPTRFPQAFVNVVFRPFPWQTSNAQSLVASLEGLALLSLFVSGPRRLIAAVRSTTDRPYLVFCACYTVLFVYGFSSFANYGILVRQRVQVLPLLLVLVCMHARRPVSSDGEGDRTSSDEARPGPDRSLRTLPTA
jgi:hypothetical protein